MGISANYLILFTIMKNIHVDVCRIGRCVELPSTIIDISNDRPVCKLYNICKSQILLAVTFLR